MVMSTAASKIKTFIKGAWSLPMGMAIPIKYFFMKTATTQYPEQRKVISNRFRGLLINDVPRCIVCELCAKVCPVKCITIQKVRKEDKKFYALQYDIDISTCLFCGLCTEACPTECLSMEGGYEGSVYQRKDLVARFVKQIRDDQYDVFSKAEGWISYAHARDISQDVGTG